MTFYLYLANNMKKKFFVEFENPDTGRTKRIYFGAIKPDGTPYSDFLEHKDKERRNRYIQRHIANENWSSPYAGAGVWSRFLLWGEPTLSQSIKAMERRFRIKIFNKTR
jgi:hypothetical protein